MRSKWVFVAAAVVSVFPAIGQGELFLTAEVMPTVGLSGLDTYRITATSDLGNVVCFDFSKASSFGVFGPINQVNPYGQATIFPNLNPQFGALDVSQDTQFLIDGNDVLSMFTEESNSYLHGVFALIGDKQLTIGNSVPFLQVATSASSAVSLKGSAVIRRANDEMLSVPIEIALSDIPIRAAPLVDLLPIPEPIRPIIPLPDPVSVLPPPPPPPYIPPVPDPVQIPQPPGPVATMDVGQMFLTAEVMPTIGRPGFDTYRITATSNMGNVVAVDLTEAGSHGVFGPLGQVNPYGQPTIFPNQNTEFGSQDPSQDTQFLVNSEEVLSMFTHETENAFHGVFTLFGEHQLAADQSLPFLQISTSAASEVSLKGSLVVRGANDEYVRSTFDISLSDIVIGPAPDVELLPISEPTPLVVDLPAEVIDPTPTVEVPPPPHREPIYVVSDPPDENPIDDFLTDIDVPPDPDADGTEWSIIHANIGDLIAFPPLIDVLEMEYISAITTIDGIGVLYSGLPDGIEWTDMPIRVWHGSSGLGHTVQVYAAGSAAFDDINLAGVDAATRLFRSSRQRILEQHSEFENAASVPEPATLWILFWGALALGCVGPVRSLR